MIIAASRLLPAFILSLCFFAGSILQFVGVLSLTQTNYLAIAAIAAFLLTSPLRVAFTRSEGVLAVLAVYVVSGLALNGSNVSGVLVYLYYIACPLLAVRFCRRLLASGFIRHSKVFQYILVFLVVQLVFVSFQAAYAELLSSISALNVIPEDMVYGTFFMSSDGSLSVFCVIASLAAIWVGPKPWVNFAIVALSFAIVFLANAKAFQQLLPLFVAWALVESRLLTGKHRAIKASLALLILLGVAAISYETVLTEARDFYAYLYEIYDFRYGDNMAQRLAPLGEILNSPLSLFGQGALTYYNPITKQWYYNAGFSLVYSFYFDYGLIGLSLILVYFFSLTREFAKVSLRSATLYAVLLVFCMFSPAITDLAFLIYYTIACAFVGAWRVVSAAPDKQASPSVGRARVLSTASQNRFR